MLELKDRTVEIPSEELDLPPLQLRPRTVAEPIPAAVPSPVAAAPVATPATEDLWTPAALSYGLFWIGVILLFVLSGVAMMMVVVGMSLGGLR